MALNGHSNALRGCLLLRVKRTSGECASLYDYTPYTVYSAKPTLTLWRNDEVDHAYWRTLCTKSA